MTTFIILVVIGLLIYAGTRKKTEQNFSKIHTPNASERTNPNQKKFQSKISTLPFPDRVNAIVWHIDAIDRGLKKGNLEFANLSYAKLIESIRQQNITEKGKYENYLEIIRKEYQEFRELYGLDYPEQFLPPSQRKKQNLDALVYLETLNYNELPKSIVQHIDIVRTVSQWNGLGFNPKQNQDEQWNNIKRQGWYFDYIEASIDNPQHKLSLETGKRITSNPYWIKALVEQGVAINSFVRYGKDLVHFFTAYDLFEIHRYEDALKESEMATSINPNEYYEELKTKIQIKLNNEDVVEEQFKKYEHDIDSAVYSGEIIDWLRVLLKNKKIDKVISRIHKTNELLDKLAKGEIKPKIYGQQSKEFYLSDKERFNNSLFRIIEPDIADVEQSPEAIELFDIVAKSYNDKEIKPIESIADVYTKWKLNDKAINLYNLCLNNLANEEKPRVKTRLAKKISVLKNIE